MSLESMSFAQDVSVLFDNERSFEYLKELVLTALVSSKNEERKANIEEISHARIMYDSSEKKYYVAKSPPENDQDHHYIGFVRGAFVGDGEVFLVLEAPDGKLKGERRSCYICDLPEKYFDQSISKRKQIQPFRVSFDEDKKTYNSQSSKKKKKDN